MNSQFKINDELSQLLDGDSFKEKLPTLNIGSSSFLTPIIGSREVVLGRLLMSLLDPLRSPNISLDAIRVMDEMLNDILKEKKKFEFDIINDDFVVHQEFKTHENGRIDFVILTHDILRIHRRAFIIELKLDADVQNDLRDYYDSIDIEDRNKIGIVLSLRDNSDLIDESKFIYISLVEYIKKLISEVTNLEGTEFRAIIELEFYLTELENSFFGQYTSSYISFFQENIHAINLIDQLYELDNNHRGREVFIKKHRDFFDKYFQLKQYTLNNIQVYFDSYCYRVGRAQNHRKENCKFYLYGKKYLKFPQLIRLTFDYSNLFKLEPNVILSIAINTGLLKNNFQEDFFQKFREKLNSNPKFEKDTFNDINDRESRWLFFLRKEISELSELKKIDNLFRLSENIVSIIEEVIKDLFSFDVNHVFDDIGKAMPNKHCTYVEHEFLRDTNEVLFQNLIYDDLYKLTFSVKLSDKLVVCIWFQECEELDKLCQDDFDQIYKNFNFDYVGRPYASSTIVSDETEVSYDLLFRGTFELHQQNHEHLRIKIEDILSKVDSVLRTVFKDQEFKWLMQHWPTK
jgi:hypothetical protein